MLLRLEFYITDILMHLDKVEIFNVQAPKAAIDKFKGKFKKGWIELDEKQLAESEYTHEIYAVTITSIIENIGRLIKELKAKGVYDNTVIMLMPDNGGNAEGEQPRKVNSRIFLRQAYFLGA